MLLTSYSKQRRELRVTATLYWCVLALLIILLVVTWRNLYVAQGAAERVRKYNNTIIELDAMFGLMRDLETGARGYLLTRDPLYKAPFRNADAEYEEHRRRLESLYRDDRDPAVDTLVLLSFKLRFQLRELVGRVDTNTVIGPDLSERVHLTKRIMDHSREVFARLMGRAEKERDGLLATERGNGFDAPSMVVIYSALAIAATALLFWRLSRALHRAERMKLALDLKVLDLNREVKERSSLQEMLQNVLDTSPSGIMAFRSVRDEQGEIVDFEWLSSSGRANTLLKRSDLVGKRLLAVMPEERGTGLFAGYEAVVLTGEPFLAEVRRQDEGDDGWFIYHAVKLEDGFVVTFSDVTEQKRAQEINIEADRLALTAQITRTIAHEVRNPLTNIHLSVEQLQDEVQDRKAIVDPFFAIIERNLRRIGTLVRQMLESSSIRELHLGPCRIRDIVDNALEAVGDRLKLKGMTGRAQVPLGLPAVLADSELIDLAITNIAVNAIEAMEPGKGELRFIAMRDDDAVILEIRDNGKGIPQGSIPRLFEPFYSGRPGGLGLGLTTARTILGNHGIKLDVRSKVGEGTSFILRFPEQIFAEEEDLIV